MSSSAPHPRHPCAFGLRIGRERAAPCKSLLGPLGPAAQPSHGGGKRDAALALASSANYHKMNTRVTGPMRVQ
jgi:hypothetical protein